MRKNMIMIGAGMMLALASCDKTEIREITEDRVVPQPVDTIKVADYFYLDGHLSRTAEDLGGRPLDAANLFNDGEELYVANFGNVITHLKKDTSLMEQPCLVVTTIRQAVVTNGREC